MGHRLKLFASEFAKRFDAVLEHECRRIDLGDYRHRIGAATARVVIVPVIIAFAASLREAWRRHPPIPQADELGNSQAASSYAIDGVRVSRSRF
jgi:hypothetical protein